MYVLQVRDENEAEKNGKRGTGEESKTLFSHYKTKHYCSAVNNVALIVVIII